MQFSEVSPSMRCRSCWSAGLFEVFCLDGFSWRDLYPFLSFLPFSLETACSLLAARPGVFSPVPPFAGLGARPGLLRAYVFLSLILFACPVARLLSFSLKAIPAEELFMRVFFFSPPPPFLVTQGNVSTKRFQLFGCLGPPRLFLAFFLSP